MKKWIIIILVALLMVTIATAIDECKQIAKPSDIPCRVTSTWDYPNACNTYNASLYNGTGENIQNYTMGDFGIYCNFTFNYSEQGSYYYNISTGDSGSILVQGEDDMASLSVMLFVGAITASLFFIGIKVKLSDNILADLILRRCAVILGLFLLSLDITMLVTIADNAGLGINREIFRYLWIVNWTAYLAMVALMWTTVTKGLEYWREISEKKSYGEE